MKAKLITIAIAMIAALSVGTANAADKAKAKADPKAAEAKPDAKADPKAPRDTYPLYAKVVSITSKTLTVVRSDAADAKEVKFAINSATEIVNGDKPAKVDDVKPGTWIGGLLKKVNGDDVVVKLNIDVKQKDADAKGKGDAKAKPDAKGTKKAGTK